ncbi:hypothetical protein C623_0232790 [Bacillus thuringiensis serovar aizawai str. Hu4-2]|nr:hypothetical protein C623_0232790 [Bacillus thuringiensis serovar aizawai str. Hu4-2]
MLIYQGLFAVTTGLQGMGKQYFHSVQGLKGIGRLAP